MNNKKLFIPKDAIERHEDFCAYYEDGDVCLTFRGPWESEKDKVLIFTRFGGEGGSIKPDLNMVDYLIKLERYSYTLQTFVLFKHYYVVGMLWDIWGSPSDPPFTCEREATAEGDIAKDMRVKLVDDFRGMGPHFEVRVAEIHKLRIAAVVLVAMLIKEYYKGLSEGEEDPHKPFWQKIRDNAFGKKGLTYEEVLAEEERRRVRASLIEMKNEEEGK